MGRTINEYLRTMGGGNDVVTVEVVAQSIEMHNWVKMHN